MSPKLNVTYWSPQSQLPLGTVSNMLGSTWSHFYIDLNNLRQGRFQLKTILGQTSRADVAIDDITIRPGACDQTVTTVSTTVTTPEPAVEKQWDCDFEKACKWVNGTGWGKAGWANSN